MCVCVLHVCMFVCVYLLCVTLQGLLSTSHNHILPHPHQAHGVSRQLNAVLGLQRISERKRRKVN